MAQKTHYEVLDVSITASPEQIRETYYLLASVWHPDRFPPGSKLHDFANRKLKQINAAYEVLKDPKKRAEYDQELLRAPRRIAGVPGPAPFRAYGNGGAGSPGLPPRAAAALAYAFGFLSGILFLELAPYRDDRFVRFHALQSVLFSAAAFLGDAAVMLLSSNLPILWVIWIMLTTGYWVFVMYRAYRQEPYRIPGIGDWAARAAERPRRPVASN